MKYLLSFFLILLSGVLSAQSEQGKADALNFQEAGKRLLEGDANRAFDKIRALEEFQKSQKILQSNNIASAAIQEENDQQIGLLFDFFSNYQDRDSLLELTRFFPDSTFRSNPRYTNEFKVLINEYLTTHNRVLRRAFLNLKNLNYTSTSSQKGNNGIIINFENFWPLAVIELDDWLKTRELGLSRMPKRDRDQLLYFNVQQQLDSLRIEEIRTNYEARIRNFQREITGLETAQEEADAAYSKMRNTGIIVFILSLLVGYFFWQRNEQYFKTENQFFLEEKKRLEDLLSTVLPTEVVRQLKNKKTIKSHKYNSVCVLFSDFQNFSQISKNLSPEELVSELDYCFTAFDRIIEKHHLQKIKTIGDAYMCVGGLYTKGGNHAQRMVLAALEIQQFLHNRKAQQAQQGGHLFNARVGVHTGPVVAGIIGAKKIAFDVWGDTVNVAQQMEHHSEVGKVNISGETYELVKNRFECKHRGEITVKNKKTYNMYFVDKMKAL
jgi:class 3 adenylate cyclase